MARKRRAHVFAAGQILSVGFASLSPPYFLVATVMPVKTSP